MKRFYALASLLLLTGILLSSCGITIEKRQHTKGYYVHTNARKQSVGAADPKGAETQADRKLAAVSVPERPDAAVAEVPAAVPEERTAIREADGVSEQRRATQQRRPVSDITNNTPETEVKERITWKEKTNTGLKKMKSSSARADSAGLSLFWIVILVLLVLWALGLIGGWGPGGLIYILLVVALILLILWLLRVV